MKKALKIIWSIVILLVAIWNIHIIYKYSGPYVMPDLDKSTVVCDNGKSFAMSKHDSSDTRIGFEYECSDFFDKISLEQYKINFGENWRYEKNFSAVQCEHRDFSFKAERPEKASIMYYRYQCSEYMGVISFEEYETNFNNYERVFQEKEVGGHTKQYVYTALSIIILFLFWYLVTFKRFDKLPKYLQLVISVGNIATILFILYSATRIIGAILSAW